MKDVFLISNNLLEQLNLMSLLVGFSVTFLGTWLLCKMSKVNAWGHDAQHGVQKFHVKPTSRLGGVAIALGLVASGYIYLGTNQSIKQTDFGQYTFQLLMAATPVWIAGLTEDVTHKVGPSLRLIMATLSAALLYGSLGVAIHRTDVAFIDWMLTFPGIPLFTTLLVVAGFTHSVNIIDGFHGLACGLMLIALAGLSFMAHETGDVLVLQLCLTSFFVFLGFFVFNWPSGSIFLGDAGAYLIGFWVVEIGILLIMRNKEISPMAPVIAGLLPLIETLFSMYRRMFIKNIPINKPDALHLHTLIYRRLMTRKNLEKRDEKNSRVAIYFWLPSFVLTLLSCYFYKSTAIQLLLIIIYFSMYFWLYCRITKFKTPKFMMLRF